MQDIKVRMWPLTSDVNSNSYIKLILVDCIFYSKHSWKSFFNTSFDIFHMHWPETYINSKNIFVRFTGCAMVISYLFYLKLNKKKIVWTVHNIKPHDNEMLGISIFYRMLVFFTDHFIFMSKVSFEIFSYKFQKVKKSYELIPHPLYPVEPVNKLKVNKNIEFRNDFLLFFGLIRNYKNIDHLIDVFLKANLTDFTLHILGFCGDNYLKRRLCNKTNNNTNINLEFKRYTDSFLNHLLSLTKGVVIPYGNMVNSGMLLKCISEGIFILLPNDRYNSEIIDYFDYKNYLFYEEELNSKDLLEFIEFASSSKRLNNLDHMSHNNDVRNMHLSCYRHWQSKL